MRNYSLGIAWNWEFDRDFIAGIERACRTLGVSTYKIETFNLKEVLHELRHGNLSFQSFYDRASDADETFLPLVKFLEKQSLRFINPPHLLAHASDKASMHLEFISHGLYVPYTIIVSPYNKKKEIEFSLSELERLGRPFIIKPANTTGGGTGVVLGAETLKDVIESRQHHQNDKYLLQEKIRPVLLREKRAWFRAFYAFGTVIPCWWDDLTHIYAELTPPDEEEYKLRELRYIMLTIHEVCTLDFFSSEIALTESGRFVVVDYVNEICDMRLQSQHGDGIPDRIVHDIEALIASDIVRYLQTQDRNAG